jgi:hypothetical protein
MSVDHFEATFVLSVDRATAWSRLTEHLARTGGWLPGFDAQTTVTARDDGARLQATKDDEPCAGTEIVVALADADAGTRITVVQSRFGDWLADRYGVMAVGWRHIVADLQTYLATGVHARRHLRPWGDLGAEVTPVGGGLQLGEVRSATLADRLGLRAGDLLVVLGGAPVSSYDDLLTALRVLDGRRVDVTAEWVRDGALEQATAAAA